MRWLHQLVGALRRRVHGERWRCTRRSKEPCSATGACLSGMLLARGDVEATANSTKEWTRQRPRLSFRRD